MRAEPQEGVFRSPEAGPALARKAPHGRKGHGSQHWRHSLSYGGCAEPKFKFPAGEADDGGATPGSVAAFARLKLMMVYAIPRPVSRFVVRGHDASRGHRLFKGRRLQAAIPSVNTEGCLWVDGHSDYGHAFEVFWDRYGKDVGPKTTVLLLGDARNNYHASQAWVVKEMRQKARHVYWLNPEPRSYWNTGDSIVGDYGTHTDGVYECRNLRQLEAFVEKLA